MGSGDEKVEFDLAVESTEKGEEAGSGLAAADEEEVGDRTAGENADLEPDTSPSLGEERALFKW